MLTHRIAAQPIPKTPKPSPTNARRRIEAEWLHRGVGTLRPRTDGDLVMRLAQRPELRGGLVADVELWQEQRL